MNTYTVKTKIGDNGLRRFVEEHADGQESVLIEVNVEGPTIEFVTDEGLSDDGFEALRLRPHVASQATGLVERETLLVRQLQSWFKEIGLKARYLRSAHAFSAKATSDQLRQIVDSGQIRAVAANRKVSAAA